MARRKQPATVIEDMRTLERISTMSPMEVQAQADIVSATLGRKEHKMANPTTTKTKINFSSVESFDPLPVGTYLTNVGPTKVRTKKNSTERQAMVKFVVNGDEHPDFARRSAFKFFGLDDPDYLWAIKKFLIDAGVDEDEFTEEAVLEELCEQAEGAPMRITIEEREGKDGKVYRNITEISPA